MNVKELLKAHYDFYADCYDDASKYKWAASNVFDLTTYDGDLDERFVKAIIEVCKVIFEKSNFNYIEGDGNYVKYILVCQLLDKFQWIEWGTSIRGAWFDGLASIHDTHPILEQDEWSEYDDEKHEWVNHVLDRVVFTPYNLRAFIEFMED